MRTSKAGRSQQQGAALLLFMLVIIVAMAAILVGESSRNRILARQTIDVGEALATARQALLDYALLRADAADGRMLALPCPDIDDSGGFAEGAAHTASCGISGETMLGRLPWRTLGLPALKDPAAACLWYAVSGDWKDAGSQTAEMINPDSNGALQLYDAATNELIVGTLPEQRAVAIVFAAMQPLDGQNRPVATASQCASAAAATEYLDSDTDSGVSNALLSGAVDSIEQFSRQASPDETHNDRVAVVTRADIADYVTIRSDLASQLRELGLAIAECTANYARNNAGGPEDRRLPWPAATALQDYRRDGNYDDIDNGLLAGRFANLVDDSNLNTGNGITGVLSQCDPGAVPAWNSTMMMNWSQWKDHFFFAVAPAFAPDAATPSVCGACLTVNDAGQYAAVLVFAGRRLAGQRRDAPPVDVDTKYDVSNYLERANALALPGTPTTWYPRRLPTTSTIGCFVSVRTFPWRSAECVSRGINKGLRSSNYPLSSWQWGCCWPVW